MVTAHDVHTVTFEKTMRGYSVEQVDEFLDKVASQIEQDESGMSNLNRGTAEQTSKIEALQRTIDEQNKRLEGYASYEDALKAALLNAQRMGENVIREAKQKAEAIVREANIRADDLTRAAETQKNEQEIELARIKSEVAQFKSNVLSLYKTHIESLSTLPDDTSDKASSDTNEKPQEAEAITPTEEVSEIPNPQADDAPVAEVSDDVSSAFSFPVSASIEKPADDGNLWDKDERELTDTVPVDLEQAEPADKGTASDDSAEKTEPAMASSPANLDTFRGISFSD